MSSKNVIRVETNLTDKNIDIFLTKLQDEIYNLSAYLVKKGKKDKSLNAKVDINTVISDNDGRY